MRKGKTVLRRRRYWTGFWVGVLFHTAWTPAWAQEPVESGVVELKVVDATTERPLDYAQIWACGAEYWTDDAGRAVIRVGGIDTCKVIVVALGYKADTFEVRDFKTLGGEVRLQPIHVMLKAAVITSTRYEKPLEKTTVSMELIRPRFIQMQSSTGVADIVDRIAGVEIIDGQANIRGGSGWSYGAGSRVLLLLDDIPILEQGAGYPNWSDLPIENIAQVEILKGAASALYGSSALNGIIHVRTQYAKDKPELELGTVWKTVTKPRVPIQPWWRDTLLYEWTAYGAYRVRWDRWDWVVGGYYRDTRSHLRESFSRFGRGNMRVRYRLGDGISAGAYVNYNSADAQGFFYWDSLYSYEPTRFVSLAKTKSVRYHIDPFFHYFSKRWNVRHRLTGRYYVVRNAVSDNRSNFSTTRYAEYQFHRPWKELGMHLTAGVVGMDVAVRAELYGDTSFIIRHLAGYVQLDKEFGEKWTLSLGMRWERYALQYPASVFGDTVSDGYKMEHRPVMRVGMNYRLAAGTFLRASWGQGYRFPTIAEQFITTEAGLFRLIPNTELRSETGWTAEVGWKQGVVLGGVQGFTDISVFWSRYRDMMEFNALYRDFQILFQSQNVGNTDIKGVEWTWIGKWSYGRHHWIWQGGLTRIWPRFLDYDTTGWGASILDTSLTLAQRNAANSSCRCNVLKYRHEKTLKLDVEWRYSSGFVGANVRYASEMRAIDRVFEIFVPGLAEFRNRHRGYTVIDIRAGWKSNGMRLTIFVENALNTIYMLRPGIMEPPRRVGIKSHLSF